MRKEKRMYRVCIADDEVYVQKSIRQRIANSGMELAVVGTAANGAEALSLYEKEKPDLFFVDINMPVLNGLDFIERVKKTDGETLTQFVIISGYDDFAYMKRAIRLDAANYIKKPILQEEFLETLQEVCVRLEEKKKYIKERTEPRLWQDFLEEIKGQNVYGTFLLVRKSGIGIRPEKLITEEGEWKTILFGKETPDLALYFLGGGYPKEQELRKELQKSVVCDAEQSVYYTGKLGRPEDLLTGFENILNLRFFHEDTRLAKLRELPGERAVFDYDIYDAALENTREEKYRECIEKIFSVVFSDVRYVCCLKQVYQSVIFVLANKYIKYDIQIPAYIKKGIFNFAVSGYKSKKEVIDSLTGYSQELNQKIKLLYTGCDLADKAAQFLEQHYAEEINLTELAEKFFVVPTYLSKRFKEKKNCTVTHYLENIRLRKARELLESTEVSILEVAQMTGYNDQNYFARSFRKVYGISPREYRNSTR